MPEGTFDEIVDKYVEMNVAHSFCEGNGRSTRIWLGLILKKIYWFAWTGAESTNKTISTLCVKALWTARINAQPKSALADKINDQEVFMKGVNYSYYYE